MKWKGYQFIEGLLNFVYWFLKADDDGMSVKDIAEALMSFGEDCEPKAEEGKTFDYHKK